jgi:hypothetical protein
VSTTGHLNANIDIGEFIGSQQQDRLVELGSEDLGGEELERCAVDLDHALALHTACNGCNGI